MPGNNFDNLPQFATMGKKTVANKNKKPSKVKNKSSGKAKKGSKSSYRPANSQEQRDAVKQQKDGHRERLNLARLERLVIREVYLTSIFVQLLMASLFAFSVPNFNS